MEDWAPTPRPRRMFRRFAIGCTTATILCCAGCGLWFWTAWLDSKPMMAAADRYMALLANGEASKAYEMTTMAFRNVTNHDAFLASLNQSTLLAKGFRFQLLSFNLRYDPGQYGYVAYVLYKISNGPNTGLFQVLLKKYNGQWLILGFNTV